MRKIAAFDELVEMTMSSRMTGLRKPASLLQRIFKITPDSNNSWALSDWIPPKDPFHIHFRQQKYVETSTINTFSRDNQIDPFEIINQLTEGNAEHKLSNSISLILYNFTDLCGSSSTNVASSFYDVAVYDYLEKQYYDLYKEYSPENVREFQEFVLTPFSDLFNQVVAISTGVTIKSSSIFCSQTSWQRYTFHSELFEEKILPTLIKKNKKSKTLLIGTLGSSKGFALFEIYEILNRYRDQLKGWHIVLEARDISVESLSTLREDTFKQLELNIELRTIPTMLGDKQSMQEIFDTSYDVLFFRKAAMYLRSAIVARYQNNLQAKYIFSTSDFQASLKYYKPYPGIDTREWQPVYRSRAGNI